MCSLRKIAAVLLSLCLLAPLSTSAHHSFEMFDQGNPIQISGEIKEFQWVNPFMDSDLRNGRSNGRSRRMEY